jgi:hypothetical protein
MTMFDLILEKKHNGYFEKHQLTLSKFNCT